MMSGSQENLGPSSPRPCGSRSRRSFVGRIKAVAAVSVAALVAPALAQQPSASPTPFPSIDFEGLGSVGVVGSFGGIEIWNSTLSTKTPANTFNSSVATLLSYNGTSGAFSKVNQTNVGGQIRAICQRPGPTGTVFVGGNFTSIAGTPVSNLAAWDPPTNRWNNVGGGVDGLVNALYCDEEQKQLLVGGQFQRPVVTGVAPVSRYLGNVAAFSYDTSSWSPVDFGGVNGLVTSIGPGSNSSLVRLTGNFETQYTTAGSLNATAGVVAGNSPSPLTIAYSPLPLGQSEFQGGPSSADAAYNDPAQILCPRGADGPGNTYLFADGTQQARLTVRTFRQLPVRAIRLGNTFVDGRGTKTFGIVSIPDNKQLELLYLDPATGLNKTCTTDCPLAQNTALPFQDFLISNTTANGVDVNGVKTITGLEFTATSFYGAGPGLHILELLSDGAQAWAYGAYNRGSCASSEPGVNGTLSGSTSQGGWYQTNIATDTPGTVAPVLALTDDYSNLANNLDAQVSFNVDVAYSGNYSVFLFVPGCQASGQCGQRTDVNVRVFNNQTNQAGVSRRISQRVDADTSVLVYEGEVQKSSENFAPSIVVSIPADAPAPTSGNRFTVIADRVRLHLSNSNETAPFTSLPGFGVFEFNAFDPAIQGLNLNGTGVLPNSTLTSVGTFASTLRTNGVQRNDTEVVRSIASVKNFTFVGGSFSSNNFSDTDGFRNIVGYEEASGGKDPIRLPGGGLNDTVLTLLGIGDFLYAGGNFTASADNTTIMRYVARYDPVAKLWASLDGGLDGPVTHLSQLGKDLLLVTGSFTSVNGSTATGGFAVFDTVAAIWKQTPAVLGSLLTSSASTDPASSISYVAGSVSGKTQFGASGAVQLEAPDRDGDVPKITPLNFVYLRQALQQAAEGMPNATANATLRSAAANKSAKKGAARNVIVRDVGRAGGSSSNLAARWLANAASLVNPNAKRSALAEGESASSILVRRAAAMEPASLALSGTDEVLSSAFWQRGKDDYVQILGGNFTSSKGIKNLAWYDSKTDSLNPFPAVPPALSNLTLVRSVLVDGDTLYAGGDGGLLLYDLKNNEWSSNEAKLAVESGNILSVANIAHRPGSDVIVVAGTFDSAGSLPCKNICMLDSKTRRWLGLANGIDGQVAALDFGGSKASTLIVAGSMVINNQETSLAGYNFDSQLWTNFGRVSPSPGDIPGPATAASVDDLNLNSIFVAGRTSDGARPFFVKWDGAGYMDLAQSELLPSTGVAQLSFVPLTKAHAENAVLESNRMLVVSGALEMRDFGNVSSALYDGANWTPFLLAAGSSGGTGVVRDFARSTEVLSFPNLHRLAVGIVILISIAIGLGVVFLLVLLGLIFALTRRRSDRGVEVPISASDDTLALAGAEKKRPSSLLATLNAATENVMGAGEAGGSGAGAAGAAGAGAAAGVAGVGTAAAMAAASSTGHGHGRQDSGAVGGTLDHSDETGPSTAYHSEGMTGRSGHSAYYSGEEGGASGGGAALGAGAAAGGAAATAAAAAAAAAAHADTDENEEGIEAHARYSFEATHPSELAVHAGQKLWILDDQDEHWWLARDASGNTGVLPATYVL